MKGLSVGLALGGGGARGFAHIGVLAVLEREGIPVDIIFGTSSGALVGGAYASGIGPAALKERMEEYLESPEFQSSAINALEDANRRGDAGLARKIQHYIRNKFWLLQAMFKPGILTAEDFQKMIDYFIPDIDVDETAIPFRAVAVDLVSGERIVFKEGPLRSAVMASCAVPGAIEPLQDGERLLADGGIISLVPVIPAREEKLDFVIAVNVERKLQDETPLKTAQEIYDRANEICSYNLAKHEMKNADILIHPDVGDLNWSDFSRAAGLIEEGIKAAESHVDAIKAAIRKKRWKKFVAGLFGAGR